MTHDEIIALIQAHKEGKEIQMFREGEWVSFSKSADFDEFLIEVGSKWRKVRIKPEPAYRAWRKDEVPRAAQYLREDSGSTWFFAEDELHHINPEYYLNDGIKYRTDLAKDEWHVCGVEVGE